MSLKLTKVVVSAVTQLKITVIMPWCSTTSLQGKHTHNDLSITYGQFTFTLHSTLKKRLSQGTRHWPEGMLF